MLLLRLVFSATAHSQDAARTPRDFVCRFGVYGRAGSETPDAQALQTEVVGGLGLEASACSSWGLFTLLDSKFLQRCPQSSNLHNARSANLSTELWLLVVEIHDASERYLEA